MTNREFFTAILSSNVSEEIKAFAQQGLDKLDARNDKRASTPSKAQIANEPIKTAILAYLNDKPAIASEIASACEISTQKVTALCKILVDEGKVAVQDVKVKGKGSLKAYTKVNQGE